MSRDTEHRRFVLQGFDPETETVSVETQVLIADIGALRRIVGAEEDAAFDRSATLSAAELGAIAALCLPPIVPDAMFTAITRWSPLNDVPYLVHTNFELPLMLDGRKPLAVFRDGYPSEWFDDYLAPFEPHVRSVRIIRRIVDTPTAIQNSRRPELEGIRNVYFALPGQEWRIDAYIRMQEAARQSGWNESFEREQGSLLGYEDWQNDWWLNHRQIKSPASATP